MLKLGIMTTLSDYRTLRVPGASFSELLLFDGDLDKLDSDALRSLVDFDGPPVEYVHAQEFLRVGRREEMVDLASEDERVRRKSVETIERTRDLAHALADLQVVIHPGGIRREKGDRALLMENLMRSLGELGPDSLLLENMPWHYWLRKQERFVSSLCVSIEDIEELVDLVEGFTLDTCHGFLSRPEGDPDYCARFVSSLGRKTLHVHASDALPPDREGLQIGDGEVDFSILKLIDVPVIAEVWRGHADGGKGFRIGIERLREMEKTW